MITYQQISFFKKYIYGIKARINIFKDAYRFYKIGNLPQLRDIHTPDYNKDISYRVNWFNFQKQSILGEWDNLTDIINGGQSQGQLYFQKDKKIITYKGYVQAKDKDRMIYYPFISILRTFPFYFKLGPLRLIQIQAKTDGKPLQVHCNIKSFIKGQVNIYGFILSKSTQWHTYQLPLQNMILRGTQQDYHEGQISVEHNSQYYSKNFRQKIFDTEFQNLQKLLRTEIVNLNHLQICNIGFRLASTNSQERSIQIKNINLGYKKGYENFVKSYQSPYFYITNDQFRKEESSIKSQVQYLNTNLQKIDIINTGDIKYLNQAKKSSNLKKK